MATLHRPFSQLSLLSFVALVVVLSFIAGQIAPAHGQPSPSASPLACGVRQLANTLGVDFFDYIWFYTHLHRIRVLRPNCVITAITVKLQNSAGTRQRFHSH
jgi:hypothetical protein